MVSFNKIYDLAQKPMAILRINGAIVNNWISLKGGEGIGSVPYLDIELPEFPVIHPRGLSVTLDAGYDSETTRVATLGLYAWGDEDPDALRTQCFVRGATLDDSSVVEVTASAIFPPSVWPPIPDGEYIDFSVDNSLIQADIAPEIAIRELAKQLRIPRSPSGSPLGLIAHALGDLHGAFRSYKIPARDLSGMGLKAAMAGVLASAGVSSWTLDFDDYTLAAEGAELDRMPASEALSKLMLLRGCSVQQIRSGQVRISVIDEAPGPTASYVYTTVDQDTARIIEASGELRIPYNPMLQSGMTVAVEINFLGISGRWFLKNHRYEIGPSGAWSYLDLVGGDEYGGSIGVNPLISFFYSVTIEVIDGVAMASVQFDASSSFDPDGILTGDMITWSDNQGGLVSGTGFVKTVTVDPADITGAWEVTATGLDSDGLSGSEVQVIDLSAEGIAFIPAIGVAGGTHSMYTPDSALNWNDNAEAVCTAVGLRPSDGVNSGHGLYGFLDGHVELTRDGNLTRATVLSAVGSKITRIAWDWRNTLVAWVLTDDCRLYVCINLNATTPTFGLYGGSGLRSTLLLAGALGNLIGLPGAGGVHIFGGTGTGFPLHAYDANGDNNWVTQIQLGDILADGPGSADLRIVGYAAPGYGGETMILGNAGGRANGSVAVYHTNESGGAPSASFTRATGLPAGAVDGRAILENGALALIQRIAIFGDAGIERNVYKSEDGIAYVETVNILGAGFSCNDAMWESNVLTGLPAFDGIYLLALQNAGTTGGVYKSTDELSTEVKPLRDSGSTNPWPSGAEALQLSIGAPGSTVFGSGELEHIGAGGELQGFDGSSNWSLISTTAAPTPARLIKLTDGHRFFLDQSVGGASSDLWHSPDGVSGFSIVFSSDANRDIRGFDVAADGTLWLVMGLGSSGSGDQTDHSLLVYKSPDYGANWELVFTDPGFDSTWNTSPTIDGLTCDKFNPQKIWIKCLGRANEPEFIYTIDGGDNWTRVVTPTDDVPGSSSSSFEVNYANSGRLVFMIEAGTDKGIWFSDTQGDEWLASSIDMSASTSFLRSFGPYKAGWGNKGVIAQAESTGSGDGARVFITQDNYATFQKIDINVGFSSIWSIELDVANDIIYIADSTDTVKKITGAFAGSPVLEDISFSVIGAASTSVNSLALSR